MAFMAEPGRCLTCTSRLCRFVHATDHRQMHRMFTLARGERIEPCTGVCVKFWTVVRGTAAICTTLTDGRRQITGIEQAGSTICGPMAHENSPIWLEALEPTQICEIDMALDMAVLEADMDFMQVMFEVVHKRLETANRHLTTLGRLDSTERVMLFLAETAARAGGDAPVHLPLSRDQIADYLGLNAETVSRVLSKLRKAGLFRFLSPTEYVVPDMRAVARRLPVPIGHKPHVPMAAIRGGTAPEIAAVATSCPVIHDPDAAA